MQTVGGRYTLDGRLGEGGMGQVFRARHVQLGKAFALKLISPAFADDSAARARFNQEAKLASEIAHPNIVSVVDYGEDPHFGAYMVMELVEGMPLVGDGVLPMSLRRALDVLAQVSDALDHIHKRGIIHGDVKADNIMLVAEADGARRRQIVRLLDFGLARRHDHEHEDGISGSPHYIAPERASGGPASVYTDVYALGVLGYLLFTGSLPFQGSVMELLMAHIHQAPDPMAPRRGEDIDSAIEALIMRAMAKNLAERHASAAAFRYELNTVMDMLDMKRRSRARGSGGMRTDEARPDARGQAVAQAFDRSRAPQALLRLDGTIAVANRAFARLLGIEGKPLEDVEVGDTLLATYIPGLLRAIRLVHVGGKPTERRARVKRDNGSPLDMIAWLFPLPIEGSEVHLIIRIEEVDPAREDR